MLHTLYKQIQRVRDLITEYDEDEDLCSNPNPALHDFVRKLKVILNAKTQITRKDGTNDLSNSKSNRTDHFSRSSSQMSVSDSYNSNPKVIEAFGNHVVLTEIFKCGNFRDLNNFRLINKQWKGIANSAIIQRRLWKLKFYKFSAQNKQHESLTELNDCIEASGGSFPLTKLDFSSIHDYSDWNSAALLRFYALMGPSIKQAKFYQFSRLTKNEFQDLLVNKMPNLEHIDAGSIFFSSEGECLIQVVLPHLKTIQIIYEAYYINKASEVQSYYKNLLLAATNLKEIQNFRPRLTDTVIESGKMSCIQTFNFALELINCSAQCNKFSHAGPKLTSLTISDSLFDLDDVQDDDDRALYAELSLSLKRSLISSRETLKYLHCVPGSFPFGFELPELPNLEVLTVLEKDRDYFDTSPAPVPSVFPARCNCSEIFPNLHTVVLDFFLDRGDTLYKHFPRHPSQLFPSVKTLEFKDSFQLGKSLKCTFPNVSLIKIMNFEMMIARTEEEIFSSVSPSDLDNQIESLEFHQCRLAHSGREFLLDSLFTGVPTHICRNLLAMQSHDKARGGDEDVMWVKEILKLVQNQEYAFRNSEGLRRLKILFSHQDNVHFRMSKNSVSYLDTENENGDIEMSKPVMTLVSCLYGFSLMPDLEQVIIGYDHSLPNASDIARLFKPFAEFPYVKIVHEPTKL